MLPGRLRIAPGPGEQARAPRRASLCRCGRAPQGRGESSRRDRRPDEGTRCMATPLASIQPTSAMVVSSSRTRSVMSSLRATRTGTSSVWPSRSMEAVARPSRARGGGRAAGDDADLPGKEPVPDAVLLPCGQSPKLVPGPRRHGVRRNRGGRPSGAEGPANAESRPRWGMSGQGADAGPRKERRSARPRPRAARAAGTPLFGPAESASLLNAQRAACASAKA